MKKPVIVALIFAGFVFYACKKDDKTTNPTATTVDLLANGAWKIDTIGFDDNKDGVIDEAIPGGFQACELDNTLTFNKDSVSGVFDEGATKCDPADPQTIDFGYHLKGDTVINFSGNLPGELQGDVNIVTLSNTQLIMSKRIVITFPPIDKNIIISLTK